MQRTARSFYNSTYVEVTNEALADLDATIKADEVIVTHVGDGEYTCNVFGNVYSNYSTVLEKARESEGLIPREYCLAIVQYDYEVANAMYSPRIYLGYFSPRRESDELYFGEVALLTKEVINDKFNFGSI